MQPRAKSFFVLLMSLGLLAACGDRPPVDTTDTETTDEGSEDAIHLNCHNTCKAMADGETHGTTADELTCALDLCGEDVVLKSEVTVLGAPNTQLKGELEINDGTVWEDCKLENMARSLKHFGDQDNDLAPLMGGSYVILSNAPLDAGSWYTEMGGTTAEACQLESVTDQDQWVNDEVFGYSVMSDPIELVLTLKAPQDAAGFRVRYVFMSSAYDNGLEEMHGFIERDIFNTYWDDKFYILKNEVGGSRGTRELINYTDCQWPEFYWMRECEAGEHGCDVGEKICPVSVLSGIRDCCYYECERTGDELDLAGTGFECAVDSTSDNYSNRGSSTGWLVSSWDIKPGEEFELIFHIHDSDGHGLAGSVVLIDSFEFLKNLEDPPGTVPM